MSKLADGSGLEDSRDDIITMNILWIALRKSGFPNGDIRLTMGLAEVVTTAAGT